MCSRCTALLVCLGYTASALLVTQRREEERGQEVPAATLRARILHRFDQVDANGDGVVSRAEMLKGFGHEPARVGEGVLDGMLAACSGGNTSAPCTRQQMETSLKSFPYARQAKSGRSYLELDVESLLTPIKGSTDGDPCGPSPKSGGEAATGFEGVVCTVQAAQCVSETTLIAWIFTSVCADSACICYPTDETKRLVKVGLMGSASAEANDNFAPQCGSAWTSQRIVDRIDNLDTVFTEQELQQSKVWLKNVLPEVEARWSDTDYVDTQVSFFKSSEHELTKGGPKGNVCMFSWQGSREDGDWKLNYWGRELPLDYKPEGVDVMTHGGHVLVYNHIRDKIKQIFEEECCTPDFTAEKLILSGHSRGANLAELHAIDVVANWKCSNGKDFGAKDIAVILIAPMQAMQTSTTINEVFSCSDPERCLSGSVVTLSVAGDWVADPMARTTSACRHPSEVYRLPCMGLNTGMMYCHVLPRYVESVEQVLVGKAGWGSSCGGTCGNPNQVMQCEQVVKATGKSCSEVPSRFLKHSAKLNTSCDARWLPSEERCDCDFASCDELTTLGCMGVEVAAPR